MNQNEIKVDHMISFSDAIFAFSITFMAFNSAAKFMGLITNYGETMLLPGIQYNTQDDEDLA